MSREEIVIVELKEGAGVSSDTLCGVTGGLYVLIYGEKWVFGYYSENSNKWDRFWVFVSSFYVFLAYNKMDLLYGLRGGKWVRLLVVSVGSLKKTL